MSTNRKIPIERRRRNLFKSSIESSAAEYPTLLRRESDEIKARILRWINLADQALRREREEEPRSRPVRR